MHVEGPCGQQGVPKAKAKDREVEAAWQEIADAANTAASKPKKVRMQKADDAKQREGATAATEAEAARRQKKPGRR